MNIEIQVVRVLNRWNGKSEFLSDPEPRNEKMEQITTNAAGTVTARQVVRITVNEKLGSYQSRHAKWRWS